MRFPALSVVLLAGFSGGTADAQAVPAPGIWTNAEDAYFAAEEGRPQPRDIALEVAQDGGWRWIDFTGTPLGEWQSGPVDGLAERRADGGWQVDGSEIRKARRFSCWVSVRKFAGKPDGSEDWSFASGLAAFDQGGKVIIPGTNEAPGVTLKLRNVTWAKGSRNRPALVLYVHRGDNERAESYAWTSPGSDLVGINLRWVQGSCSLADGEGER